VTTRTTEEARGLIRYGVAMATLTVIVVWCAFIVRDALLIVYVSMVLAIGFSPIVRIIERQKVPAAKRVPRWLAILTLYVAILGTLALVIALVFPPLVQQASALWDNLPTMFERTQQFLISHGWLKEHLTMREAVARAPGGGSETMVARVAAGIANVAGGLFGVVTILILTFYMLVDSWSLRQFTLRLFPRKDRERVDAASRQVMEKVSAWLAGQLLLAGVIGTTSAVGLWALGIPFFYVLALLSAVGEMIPIIGPILSAIPAIAVAATLGIKKVILVMLFFILQQQLENHILVPKIMSRQVGLSPVTVIVSLLIGGSLLGIVGAILAIPTAAILQVIASEMLSEE
jgi:predicted PurR-regulated permease PerM